MDGRGKREITKRGFILKKEYLLEEEWTDFLTTTDNSIVFFIMAKTDELKDKT